MPEKTSKAESLSKQERELVRDAFLELKREIHNRAVHTHSRDVYDFINIKVFDAVLQNQIRKYTEENGEESDERR